jgi:hypothetical protein
MSHSSSQKGFIQHSTCRRCYTSNGKLSAGFTLFYAVLVASLLLAIGLAIFNITFKEVVLSSGARESANAFYAADTGLECALYWDLKHGLISSPAFGAYGDSLASGLVVYWRFEDGNGSLTTVDSSGGGNVGTLTNMPGDNTTWVDGQVGKKALFFDGVNDYVDIAPVDLTGEFTISLWYNTTNDGAFARMISGGGPEDNPGAGRKFGFLNTDGVFYYLVRIVDGGASDSKPVGSAAIGWHHMVLRRNSSNRVDLIIDDSRPQVLFSGAPQAGTFRLYDIGKTPSQLYLGILDDFRIYNRALSAIEVQQLYNQQSNLQFVQPIVQNTPNVTCISANITNPTTGWSTVVSPSTGGWDVATTTTSATTTFDMLFDNARCATVTVVKNVATTSITSRGYNNCNLTDPRRVERAIKATY